MPLDVIAMELCYFGIVIGVLQVSFFLWLLIAERKEYKRTRRSRESVKFHIEMTIISTIGILYPITQWIFTAILLRM